MKPCVSNNGTAAVVDGATVLLTPLQRALVPPPMCSVAAVFPQAVQCLAFTEYLGDEVGCYLSTAAAALHGTCYADECICE